MDDLDRGILDHLTRDARMSFREISRRLGVSPDTVSSRYERLRKDGVILGSTVVLDPRMIGYSFICRFGVDVKPAYSSQVLERIIEIPSVIIASKVVGTYDLVAISVVKDFEHLCTLYDTILEMPYVERCEIGLWMNEIELSPKYFII